MTNQAPLHPDRDTALARMKWLAELRKPTSKRHLGELESPKDPFARCCLGHACAALIPERRTSTAEGTYLGRKGYRITYMDQSAQLPPSVAKMLDIHPRGYFIKPVQCGRFELISLIQVNDKARYNPKQIALLIERNCKLGNFVPYSEQAPDGEGIVS